MRVRNVILAIGFGACAGGIRAQTPATVPMPSPLVPAEATGLPVGTDVSRPLTVVQMPVVEQPPAANPTVVPPPQIQKAVEKSAPTTGLHRWDSSDLLLWWYKAAPIPPLVTAARGSVPGLDNPTATLLVGGTKLASGMDGGGRFVFGHGFGDDLFGYEFVYAFHGGQDGRFNSTDLATRGLTIGRPYVDAATGREDALVVSAPGTANGYVDVATSTRVSTWEINGVGSLLNRPNGSLVLLAGYRYFRLKDGLHVEHAYTQPGGLVVNAADQFDTGNQFHGAQVGFKADLSSGAAFVEVTGKVALGQNNQRIDVNGQTNVYSGTTALAVAPGGLLAVASNTGRFGLSQFAVLPEAGVKVGFQTGDHSRFSIGYNLIYLNTAVRPGDQVDRIIDTAQVPAFSPAALAGLPPPADRPGLPFQRTDFWVQGLVFSWDLKY